MAKNQGSLPGSWDCFALYPVQAMTGRRGYFGNSGFISESRQKKKALPREFDVILANSHELHKPTPGW
jgi:hypothetical protein